MDDRTRAFIQRSTLLFIASRNPGGGMDISPRGGQPCVLRIAADGRLLLPDYVGNRRLDTIGNLLAHPDVALLLLNRGSDEYLRISARAEVSQHADDIAAFPSDENRPLSVIVLKPEAFELVGSTAFRDSGFWVGPSGRKPPLEVLEIYASDGRWQAEGGRKPVLYDAAAESRLAATGLRDFYGTPGPLVQTKVYEVPGPGFMGFINAARFIAFAHENAEGGIVIDLAGSPLRSDLDANSASLTLDFQHEGLAVSPMPHAAGFALLAVEPGRSDSIRVNGTYRQVGARPDGRRLVSLQSDEIYFHCSASLARSRIWTDSRPVAWSGRRSFTCVGRRRENPDVVSLMLQPRDAAPVGDVLPGQYVTISAPGDDRALSQRRCYSVSAVPDARTLRISVRRMGDGGVSALLHDSLAVGDEVLVGPPAGRFVLGNAPARPVALVSAGVGITPLLPMLERLAREDDGRDVWFVHAARNSTHHLFGREAKDIARAHPRIRLVTAYSQPREGDACDHRGRLDASALALHVPIAEADFYLCGPKDFMASLAGGLVDLGASPQSIRREVFDQKGESLCFVSAEMPDRLPCAVTFARTGRSATWQPSSGSLLDLALASGVHVQYSCRSGECQSCVQRVVSGSVTYPLGEEPLLARGQALLCQSIPRGDVVIDC